MENSQVHEPPSKNKSRKTAILLAVFLGPWTWLYTVSHDRAKFFIGTVLLTLSLTFLIFGQILIWILQCSRCSAAFCQSKLVDDMNEEIAPESTSRDEQAGDDLRNIDPLSKGEFFGPAHPRRRSL